MRPALACSQVEKKKGEARREAEAVKAEQRGRDVAQRRLNRAELEAKQLQEQLPGLHNTVHNLTSQLAADQREAAAQAQAARTLQAEVEGVVVRIVAEKKLVRKRTLAFGWLCLTFPAGAAHPCACILPAVPAAACWSLLEAQRQRWGMAASAAACQACRVHTLSGLL